MKKLDEKYWKIIKYVALGAGVTYGVLLCVHLIFGWVRHLPTTMSSVSGALSFTASLLAPFLIGLVFAYLFDPVVDFFQEKVDTWREKKIAEKGEAPKSKHKKIKAPEENVYKKRVAGTALLYLVIFSILGILITLLLNKLNFTNNSDEPFSAYIIDTIVATANYVTEMNEDIQRRLLELGVGSYVLTIVNTIFDWIKGFTTSLVTLTIGIAQGVFVGFLGLVMGFYLLVDKDAFKKKTIYAMNVFIPEKANANILGFFSQLHGVFSGYIRGQLMDAAIYGTLVGITLSIIGMPYAFVIGVVSGFCNLIPYVGAIVAFTMSITIGLFSGNPMLAVYASIAIFALQQIDSMYIYPKCVANNIDINPLLVILALSVGGSLFGLVGMLFAVPVTSLIKTLLGQLLEAQAQSGSFKKMFTKKDDEN